MLPNKQWIIKDIKGEIKKKPRAKWKHKYNIPKYMGWSKSGYKREVHNNTSLA